MEDLQFDVGPTLQIQYRFQKARFDCKHLLIVMSGFNSPDPTAYDFTTTLHHCHSAILWIKDDFNRLPAYYLCQGMDFAIEAGVSALIDHIITTVNPGRTSIIGASKGGSAALWFAVKHNILNVIACVPQLHIGSYLANSKWQETGRVMMGSMDEQNIARLDALLPQKITADRQLSRNIYLFTSPEDEQYTTDIQPYLPLFERYQNFNLVETHSRFVSRHEDVTRYNVNLVLALVYQFEDGITP
ncbi:hypothetical protein F9C28_01805 [Shimwellia pseudoproteus]|uniref:hypothetical protein n=1 Tax=Shimwellia pseudoproteus TaxID=570012 RepID=UPI0018EBDCF9|nr:hypothetical protein [Shimwellia pseudoproteus]MBJ3813697.1 hypothetical protein [Shimwellia pseudoproteus]